MGLKLEIVGKVLDLQMMMLLLIIIILVCSPAAEYCLIAGVHGDPQAVPCYFVFGDSLYDTGNNNLLATTSKSNYPPYGVDFPLGPSGRFSNGFNTADAYAKLLGFPNLILPYATATNDQILQGVNYASGGAGIRDETSSVQGARVSMNLQLVNHEAVIGRIRGIVGSKEAAMGILNKCLYTVGIGSNDYLGNYLLPQLYNTSKIYTPDQYAALLVQQLSLQLTVLYNQGARKVALLGLAFIGCTPYVVETMGGGLPSVCVDYVNAAVQLFNNRLPQLVDSFNLNFPGAHFTYIDNLLSLSLPNFSPQAAGFKVSDSSCCERARGQWQCTPFGKVCPNRNEYLFWDGVHPTSAFAFYAALSTYTAVSPLIAHPYDIKTLALLPI